MLLPASNPAPSLLSLFCKVPTVRNADGSSTTFKEGDWLSINGTTGEIIRGQQLLKKPEISGNLASFMEWVSQASTIADC